MLHAITDIPKEAFDGDSLTWHKYLTQRLPFLLPLSCHLSFICLCSNLKMTKLYRSKEKMKTVTYLGTGQCNLLMKKVTPSISIEKGLELVGEEGSAQSGRNLNRSRRYLGLVISSLFCCIEEIIVGRSFEVVPISEEHIIAHANLPPSNW